LNINIILGCNGNVSGDRFCYCNSVENIIVDLSSLNDFSSRKVIDFIDNACGLFDKPCFDYMKVCNIIKLLYRNFEAIDKEMLESIQGFIKMHRSCGIYLMLRERE
tara:strand:- start:696 stop:1013 length:318 start_codon:yes stop_codon:yes gene_type:complete